MPPVAVPPPSDREVHQFGLVLGLLIALGGGYLIGKGGSGGVILLAIGGFVVVGFRRDWPGTRPFFSGWMSVAGFMGRVMTTLLLIGLYLMILTPLAWLARLCGERFIDKGFRSEQKSYWLPRKTENDSGTCEKQY